MRYCLYLRKSRTDTETDGYGEEDTLIRHEKTLIELAKKLNFNVTKIYREIVSGETIAARPVMRHLLQEVEHGIWNGVIVMEVERLARGDTIDQGIVAQTFKFSNTKIITPLKIYDPNNEFDEEYFEFGLFMSRREYKTINRRLQRGRIASVKEGKYVGNKPPYGYERVRINGDKGWTLSPIKGESEIINLIFELYTVGEQQSDGTYKRLGTGLIARRLNNMKIPSKTGGNWSVSVIRDILTNPVYIGKIRWNWRKNIKKVVNGKISISRPRSDYKECIIVKGIHLPIISEETFNLAQKFMNNNHANPIGERNIIKNPLSGIVICEKCGRHMIRRSYAKNKYPDVLMCTYTSCNNVSSHLDIVEARILQALKKWLGEYKLKWNINLNEFKQIQQTDIKCQTINKFKSELDILYKQLNKTYDLLEQGIYDKNTFIKRSHLLNQKINQLKDNITKLEINSNIKIVSKKSLDNIIPNAEKLLEVYNELPTAKSKNDMLKQILEKVIYNKKKNTRWHGSPDDFEITIYPKIPMYTNDFLKIP